MDTPENTHKGNHAVTKRLNVNLTEKASRELDDLANSVGATKTELVKHALGLVKILIEEGEGGNRLMVVSKDGKTTKEVILPF